MKLQASVSVSGCKNAASFCKGTSTPVTSNSNPSFSREADETDHRSLRRRDGRQYLDRVIDTINALKQVY
jgi:hypothetical protein